MNRSLAKLTVFLLVLGAGAASILPEGNRLPTTSKYVDYLTTYGYLDDGPIPSAVQLREAVESMQRFWGLPVTGEIDEQTAETMVKPRCGVRDMPRQERYSSFCNPACKWDDLVVTYMIKNTPRKLSLNKVRSIYRKAFSLWGSASKLSFQEVNEKAKIKIVAVSRYHVADQNIGQDRPFDGPGGVAGHAFSPGSTGLSGDVHLDNDEEFTDGVASGTNLLAIFTHEVGHALGLGHSVDITAVMYPIVMYNPTSDGDLKLGKDDIKGIQSLYGNPVPIE